MTKEAHRWCLGGIPDPVFGCRGSSNESGGLFAHAWAQGKEAGLHKLSVGRVAVGTRDDIYILTRRAACRLTYLDALCALLLLLG